jgi:hypothetical protein
MLDIKLIREQTEAVRRRLATRGAGDEALGSSSETMTIAKRMSLNASDGPATIGN